MSASDQLRVLILDFDGVVVESKDVKTDAVRELFGRFPEHVEEMMAWQHANVSVTRFAKFDQLLSLLGREGDTALRGELAVEFSRLVSARMLQVPLVPGAEAFLAAVSPRVPMYLASVTPAEELGWILEQRNLRHWFRDVYGMPPWPKADAIRDVLKREQVDAGSSMLIGDSAGDQRAAQSAGVEFLARNSGLTFDDPPPVQFPDLTHMAQHLSDRLP